MVRPQYERCWAWVLRKIYPCLRDFSNSITNNFLFLGLTIKNDSVLHFEVFSWAEGGPLDENHLRLQCMPWWRIRTHTLLKTCHLSGCPRQNLIDYGHHPDKHPDKQLVQWLLPAWTSHCRVPWPIIQPSLHVHVRSFILIPVLPPWTELFLS